MAKPSELKWLRFGRCQDNDNNLLFGVAGILERDELGGGGADFDGAESQLGGARCDQPVRRSPAT